MEFADALEQLRQRLIEDPDNAEGWTLLARSLAAMQRHAESLPAFRRASELAPGNIGLMTDFGETLMVINNGQVSPEALQLFRQVQALSPDHPAAVYYIGLASVQQGNVAEGMERWAALARKAPPGADWLPFLEDQMRQLAANSDARLPDEMTAPASGGPTREQMEAAQEMTPDERMEMIRSMVEGLEARLRDEPDDLAGWQRLARAWRVLGETEKAETAEQRIRELQQAQQ
ncbi:MAG: tetratricopeptide repeat protein [Rhodospirillales bacterium]